MLSRCAFLLGGAAIGSQWLLESCSTKPKEVVSTLLTDKQIDLLGDIAEVIIPETTVPGAKEAGVGPFISMMLADCYTAEEQNFFLSGLQEFESLSHTMFNNGFQVLPIDQQTEVLQEIEKSANVYRKNKKADEPKHCFRTIKELTLLGYFTSEVGATQALRYNQVPGKYDGEFPYKKGDRGWA